MTCCVYCGREKKDILIPWIQIRTTSNPKVSMDICPKCHEMYRQMLRGKEFKGQITIVNGKL